MLAGAQGVDGDVAVVVDVRGDADHVDRRIVQKLSIVGVPPPDAVPVGQLGSFTGDP